MTSRAIARRASPPGAVEKERRAAYSMYVTLATLLAQRTEPLDPEMAISLWREGVSGVIERLGDRSYLANLRLSSFGVVPDNTGVLHLELLETEQSDALPPGCLFEEGELSLLAAPEQTGLVEESCDVRTNVYSLAVLGYMLIMGRPPYPDLHASSLKEEILRTPLPEVTVAGLAKEELLFLNRLLNRAADRDASERHETIENLLWDIRVLGALLEARRTGVGRTEGILLGREHELEHLREELPRVRNGAAAVLLLLGEPGVGKTALYHHLEATTRKPGDLWAYFKASQIGSRPFEGIGAVVRAVLEAAPGHRPVWDELAEQKIESETIRLLQELSTGQTRILSRDTVEPLHFGDPDRRYAEVARALRLLCAKQEATVLAFDDVQWLDHHSLKVLRALGLGLPDSCLLLFLGRPKADELLAPFESAERLFLTGLSSSACIHLLERLLRRTPEEAKALVAQHYERSQGNPLVLLNLVEHWPEGSRTIPSTGEASFLESVARARLNGLSAATTRLLMILSILRPPIPHAWLHRIADVEGVNSNIATALSEGFAALLLRIDGRTGVVEFTHDTIEEAIRKAAMRDEGLVATAAQGLLALAKEGAEPAIFSLAGFLSSSDVAVSGKGDFFSTVIPARDAARILSSAVERTSEMAASGEAYAYVQALLGRYGRLLTPPERLAAHIKGHEAAFYLDDPEGMSRHFRYIKGNGPKLEIIRARLLWVSRLAGKSRFYAALRVARLAFAELDIEMPLEKSAPAVHRSERQLFWFRLSGVWRRLRRLPAATEPRSSLIAELSLRLTLPVYAARPDLFPFLAATLIATNLRWGRTRYMSIGVLHWMLYTRGRTERRSALVRLGARARQFATTEQDRRTREIVEIVTDIFTEPWSGNHRRITYDLLRLSEEAFGSGNPEFGGYAGHMHGVGALYTGEELQETFARMAEIRRRIDAFGLHRISNANAKYQQGVECLMGGSISATELTGSVGSEEEFVRSYVDSNDFPALAGFYVLKGFLISYDDDPERAVEVFRVARRYVRHVRALQDSVVYHFYYAHAALRLGNLREAAEGKQMVRYFARLSRVNNHHRHLALKAERAFQRGRRRRGSTLYRRAVVASLDAGYIHEAAFFAERCGSVSPDTGEGRASLAQAYTLYRRWGAIHAAERVARKLGWSQSHSGETLARRHRFLTSLVETESTSAILRASLSEILRSAAAEIGYLHAGALDGEHLFRLQAGSRKDATVERVEQSDLDPQLLELLRAAEELPAQVEIQGQRALVIGSSSRRREWSVAVLLIRSGTTSPFASATIDQTRSNLKVATSLLTERLIHREHVRQQEELESTQNILLQSRHNRKLLLDTISEALLLFDESGVLLTFNAAARPYVTPEESDVTEVLRQVIESEITRPLGKGRAVTREIRFEDRLLQLRINRGRRVFALSLQDVTDTRALEDALRAKERQLILADRLSSLGMLASTVAHEVGNPNYVIQLNLQALEIALANVNLDVAGTTVSEIVRQIADGSARIDSVIRRIKEYGRGGSEEEWTRTSVNDVCHRAIGFSRLLIREFTDDFLFESADGLPEMELQPKLLEQAVVNLIKNGCEALPDRKSALRLRTRREAGSVLIQVCDEGAGIDQKQSIVPFETGREESGGTGLGLSIVSAIAEKHGGQLRFRSDAQFATIAEIVLPDPAA